MLLNLMSATLVIAAEMRLLVKLLKNNVTHLPCGRLHMIVIGVENLRRKRMSKKMTLEKICQLGLVFSGGEEEGGDEGFVNSAGVFLEGWAGRDEFKENEATLSRYKNVTDLANSLIATKTKYGKNADVMVEIPGETSSDEVKAAWRKAKGVPDSVDAYEYEMSDEMAVKLGPLDDKKLTEFRDFAQKQDWSPKQFKDALDFYHTNIATDIDLYDVTYNEQLKEDQEKGTVELKKLWLGDYDTKVLRANAVLRKYGGEEAVASFNAQNSPLMAQFLDKIAESMSETQLTSLVSSASATAGDIKAKLAEVREQMDKIIKDNPVNFAINAQYKELLERKHNLYKQKAG